MKNLALKNKYRGKRIFILGNGASLNDIDLSLLRDEYTMGCNFIALHKDFHKLDLSFYIDPATKRSIWATGAPETIKVRGPIPTETVERGFTLLDERTQGMRTQFFFDVSMKRYIKRNRLFLNHDLFYVMSGNGLLGNKIELDLAKPLSTMEGSLFFMINVALYMGFAEIYLCGCGYTYSPQQQGHFYDDFVLVEPIELDPRHQLLKEIATQRNVTIFNIVPDGFKSPVYQAGSMTDFEQKAAS